MNKKMVFKELCNQRKYNQKENLINCFWSNPIMEQILNSSRGGKIK